MRLAIKLAVLLSCLAPFMAQAQVGFGQSQPFLAKDSTTANALLTSLAEYWTMDYSNTTYQGSANLTNLFCPTLSLTPTNATGVISNCAGFNGNAAQILTSGHPLFNTISNAFTVSIWFKPRNEANNRSLIARWNLGEGDYNWNVTYAAAGLVLTAVSDTGGYSIATLYAKNNAITNNWIHLAFGRNINTIDGRMWYVLNGGARVTIVPGAPGTFYGLYDYGTTVGLGVGNWSDGSHGWVGYIDEVGFWTNSLTDAQVLELYNSGSGKTYPFN